MARSGDPAAMAYLLVRTPSVNPALDPNGQGEKNIARLVHGWLADWGLDVHRQEVLPGRPNVVARLAGTGPVLLLNGHLDTVGASGVVATPGIGKARRKDEAGRSVSPASRDGGFRRWEGNAGVDGSWEPEAELRGRGSCDMKGGVASLLAAACRLAGSDGPRPNLVVALTVDEEHASLGMRHLLDSGLRADLAVVCEPTSLAVAPAHKGFVWAKVRFRGVSAHGSRPEKGVDAIRHAALYLAELDRLHDDLSFGLRHPLLERGSFHIGTIHGGTADSVYPDRCTVTLERRTLPGETAETFVGELEEAATRIASSRRPPGSLPPEIAPVLERSPSEVPVDSALVQGLLSASDRAGLGRAVRPMTAWVEASLLNEAGIPAVCFGPGDMAKAHGADERVPLTEIEACARVLEDFARSLATSWS